MSMSMIVRPAKTTADGDTREDSLNMHDGSNAARMESGTSANNYGVATHREAVDVSAYDSNNSEARQSQALDSRRTVGSSVRGMAKVEQPTVRSSGPKLAREKTAGRNA